MKFDALAEFEKDLKYLLKQYRTLREDLAVVQQVLEQSPNERPASVNCILACRQGRQSRLTVCRLNATDRLFSSPIFGKLMLGCNSKIVDQDLHTSSMRASLEPGLNVIFDEDDIVSVIPGIIG